MYLNPMQHFDIQPWWSYKWVCKAPKSQKDIFHPQRKIFLAIMKIMSISAMENGLGKRACTCSTEPSILRSCQRSILLLWGSFPSKEQHFMQLDHPYFEIVMSLCISITFFCLVTILQLFRLKFLININNAIIKMALYSVLPWYIQATMFMLGL